MWEFTHEETIEAPMEVVFDLMTDLPNYKNWNPFLVTCSGQVEIGGVPEHQLVHESEACKGYHGILETGLQ
jgi:hypothetical protein